MQNKLQILRTLISGIVLTVPLLAGCASLETGSQADAASTLTIEESWARTETARENSAAYLVITNEGAASDRLIAASTDVAGAAEIHEVLDDHGVMKMREIASIDIEDIVSQVERRLGLTLAPLVLGIIGILSPVLGQPAIEYLSGTEMHVTAAMEGTACGSHLEWNVESREIAAGTRVTVANDSRYWQIPVVIERKRSDGTFVEVSSSPTLRGGESWTHTFWRGGEYRIASADETQRLAGLQTVVTVK